MRVQVPMVRQGVVESLMAVLARVTGSTSEALAVQEAACTTLQNLAAAADNKVRMRGWDRSGFEECAVRC